MFRTVSARGALVILGAFTLAGLVKPGALAQKSGLQPVVDKVNEKSAKNSTKTDPGATAVANPNDDPLVYRVGVEDELGISVWHEPDVSTTAVVRPDGMITLPLLNDVHVAGMTTKELQDKLTDQLKPFVKEPQVTVIARQIRSRKVYLMGEVVHPGTYQLNNMKTVLQLLAEAGGPGAYAKVGSIYVIRQQAGSRTLIPFHYKKALSGKKIADDILLQPGDMVVVP